MNPYFQNMLIDSHCHLEKFVNDGTIDAVLARAAEAGVGRMVAIGTHAGDWPVYSKLAAAHPGRVSWTAGLHPSDVGEAWEAQVAQLEACFTQTPRPVAVGEIGIDHFRLPKDPEARARNIALQEAAFARQLTIAARLGVPVVVHSRAAHDECVRIIDASDMDWSKVVFHCFVDGPEQIKQLNDRGGRASFTGIITYKKNVEHIRAAALQQGLDRLMVETDAPYLAPEPHRGKTNEPAFVKHVAGCLAGVFGVAPEALARVTRENTSLFFDLDG